MESVFDYWKFQIKLIQPMLGTQASVDIMHEFVNEKNKKQMELAARSEKKLLKSLKKFKGDELTEEKEIEELTALLRQRQQLIGVMETIPTTLNEILEYSKELEDRVEKHFEDKSESSEVHKATCFLRDQEGHPAISTHMVLGQVKQVIANITNNSKDKTTTIWKSKCAASEGLSMDMKFLETLVPFNSDIEKNEDGSRKLVVRPLRFMRMGQSVTAIAASEAIPAGAECMMTLRIRRESPLNNVDTLQHIFQHAKNIGLGAYRNSAMYGAYVFKLEKLEGFKEKIEEGWM